MEMFFEEYLRCLESLHDEVVRAIEGLPEEALDWVLGSNMNSVGVLAVHTSGAERYWIGDVVGRMTSSRDREAEFRAKGLGSKDLIDLMSATLKHSRSVLNALGLGDLAATRRSPRDGEEFTVAWALLHALEHTALHAGHVQITKQLWEQNAGL